MRRNTARLAVLLISALLTSLAAGSAEAAFWEVAHEDHRTWFLQFTGGVTMQRIEGDLSLDGSSKLDVDDTLDLDNAKTYWGRLDFQPFIGHHLVTHYQPLSFKGENTLGEDLDFNGAIFPAGDLIESKIDLTVYDFSYRYDLFLGEKVNVSPIVSATLIDAKVEVEDKTAGLKESEDILFPMPALGVRVEGFPISRVGIFGEAKGFALGSKAITLNAEGGLSIHLIRNLALNATYRYTLYDVDHKSLDINTVMSGPYVGLSLRY
jgi:opacity protein-like surface antigen